MFLISHFVYWPSSICCLQPSDFEQVNVEEALTLSFSFSKDIGWDSELLGKQEEGIMWG